MIAPSRWCLHGFYSVAKAHRVTRFVNQRTGFRAELVATTKRQLTRDHKTGDVPLALEQLKQKRTVRQQLILMVHDFCFETHHTAALTDYLGAGKEFRAGFRTFHVRDVAVGGHATNTSGCAGVGAGAIH